MTISRKIQRQMEEGSWIRRMFEEGILLKQRFGEDKVFDLSLGNPVIEPPPEFERELRRLSEKPTPGMHRYMPNPGYAETRAAVAAQLSRETGVGFTAGEVVLSCGAGGALNVVLKAILNEGDEVVIFAPYFVEYGYYVDNHGGVPRVAPTDGSFNPDLGALDGIITARTRAVLINSPNNPTGVIYSPAILRQLGELLAAKERQYGTGLFLLSDEPYRRIIFDGLAYPHIYRYHPASLAVTSHSKDLALPGERIGYIAVNPEYPGRRELVDGLTFCNRTLGFVNAPALMQHIVQGLQGVTVDVGQYQRRRDYLYAELTGMGYSIVKPQGAFYLFPKSPLEDDVAFVRELQKHGVLTVPGRGFGTPGYFRIAYCTEERTLEGAMEGFRKAARAVGLL